jgi:hypothetical protein
LKSKAFSKETFLSSHLEKSSKGKANFELEMAETAFWELLPYRGEILVRKMERRAAKLLMMTSACCSV